jgi:hypothetical protein
LTLAKILVLASALWAVVCLTVQVVLAWGGGRRDFSRSAGTPARGLVYNFTAAMLPSHKETVSLHPGKFAIGVTMHLGVIIALACVLLLLVWPATGLRILTIGRPLLWVSLLAGLYLLGRRILSREMRAISVPDDFLAILASCGLLAFASLPRIDADHQTGFLFYSALLLIYLPLGKLRHAVFFFVARGDYGRRLGYRGTYPPAPAKDRATG